MKIKQILSIFLALLLISSIFSGCNETIGNEESIFESAHDSNEPIQVDLNKWVLTSESSVATWTGNNAITQTEYRYDEQGRLNYQKLTSDTEYTYSNFLYDNKGNVISCTETIDSDDYWAENLCSYTYDKDGRVTASKKIDAEGHEEKSIVYDKNGNIQKEIFKYYSSGELDEITNFEYTLKYENELCVMAEINITGEEYYGDTPYAYSDISLKKYYYDSNGRKIKEEVYWDDDNGDVVVNGKHYGLEKTITYTWQRLGDIIDGTSNSNIAQSNDNNIIEEDNNYYNGFSAPTELNLVYSDNKASFENSVDYRIDIGGLKMITDTDGYNYIVLNYSVTCLADTKIKLPSWVPSLEQNGSKLERYYSLSDECEQAYADILKGQPGNPLDLRPGETDEVTLIYEIYDTTSNITLLLSPVTYITSQKYEVSIVREYSF